MRKKQNTLLIYNVVLFSIFAFLLGIFGWNWGLVATYGSLFILGFIRKYPPKEPDKRKKDQTYRDYGRESKAKHNDIIKEMERELDKVNQVQEKS